MCLLACRSLSSKLLGFPFKRRGDTESSNFRKATFEVAVRGSAGYVDPSFGAVDRWVRRSFERRDIVEETWSHQLQGRVHRSPSSRA